jgi:hypothetical protein
MCVVYIIELVGFDDRSWGLGCGLKPLKEILLLVRLYEYVLINHRRKMHN